MPRWLTFSNSPESAGERNQFNPAAPGAKSLGQWLTAVTSMKGESNQMTVPAAVEMIRATPPARRSEFARQIWALRREHGTDKTP
jgi:hypothetical protein